MHTVRLPWPENASVFVGAGLSQSAGYPGWGDLLAKPRENADIAADLSDLPLVAQYILNEGDREALNNYILRKMSATEAAPSSGHYALAKIPVATSGLPTRLPPGTSNARHASSGDRAGFM